LIEACERKTVISDAPSIASNAAPPKITPEVAKGRDLFDVNTLPVDHPRVIKGVDLSKWQGAVDFTKLKAAGKSYVFIRATLGKQER